MKKSLYLVAIILVILACSSRKPSDLNPEKQQATTTTDTIKIINEALEYEVIIIEPGFDFWLNSTALPRGYHSQSYLEIKNNLYISEWNSRVVQPHRYPANLYEMSINYDSTTNYGYEVNYLIYNYMIYFQNKYHQKLYGYVPSR